ncbi:MAG TPA: hypothetical protein VM715_11185, partial [Candidatus Acidoferrum sp.]|nr:hypothetical protein [Candidatus Acidoferrum sp.]
FAFFMPVSAQSCKVQVRVIDADTGDGLGGEPVILYDPPDSHGSVHVKTDAKGNACLDVTAPSRDGFLVGTSSFRYRPIASFPIYKSVPQDVTIRLRRISLFEAIKDAISGP